MAASSCSSGERSQKAWPTSRSSRQWCVKPAAGSLVTARCGVAEPGTHQVQGDARPAAPAQVAPVSLSELQGPVVTLDN